MRKLLLMYGVSYPFIPSSLSLSLLPSYPQLLISISPFLPPLTTSPPLTNHLPAENLEKPTPRAITERIARIRTLAKSSGSMTDFSVTKGKGAATDGNDNGSTAGTPRKRGPAANNKSAQKDAGTPTKRKRVGKADVSDDDETQQVKGGGKGSEVGGSPSKRKKDGGKVKSEQVHRGMGDEHDGMFVMENPFGGDGAGDFANGVFA